MDVKVILTEIALSSGLFVVLYALLSVVIFKPLFAYLERREASTEGREQQAKHKREATIEIERKVQEGLSDARQAGNAKMNEIVSVARGQAQSIIESAYAQSQSEIKVARAEIEDSKLKAQDELGAGVPQLVDLIEQSLLGVGDTGELRKI